MVSRLSLSAAILAAEPARSLPVADGVEFERLHSAGSEVSHEVSSGVVSCIFTRDSYMAAGGDDGKTQETDDDHHDQKGKWVRADHPAFPFGNVHLLRRFFAPVHHIFSASALFPTSSALMSRRSPTGDSGERKPLKKYGKAAAREALARKLAKQAPSKLKAREVKEVGQRCVNHLSRSMMY